MNRTLFKDLFREILKSRNRFLSIFAIVALGAGFFAGIQATCPDMLLAADAYYDEYNLMDLKLLSTYGFSDKDIEAVREDPGIQSIYPSHSKDVFLKNENDVNIIVRLMSLPDSTTPDYADPTINSTYLLEGRMPQAPNECLAENNVRLEYKFKVGQQVQVFTDDPDDPLEDTLARDTYTVVGIIKSPQYISFERGRTSIGNGALDCFVYIPQENFVLDVYTELYLRMADTAGLSAFEDLYKDRIDASVTRFEDIAEVREEERFNEVREKALEELADARQELADGEQEQAEELADAREELADAWQKLQDASVDLTDARADLDQGWIDLEEGREKYYDSIAKAEKKLAKGEEELKTGQDAYMDGVRQASEGKKQLEAAKAQFAPQWEQYQTQKQALETAEAQFEATIAQAEAAAKQKVDETLGPVLNNAKAYLTGPADETRKATISAALAGIDPNLDAAFLAAAADPTEENQAIFAGAADQTMSAAKENAAAAAQNAVKATDQYQQFAAGKAQLDAAAPTIEGAKAEIERNEALLAEGDRKLDEAGKELIKANKKIKSARRDLEDGRVEGLAELEDAEQELRDGEAEYRDGLIDYQDGLEEYRDGVQEYKDGKAESDAEIADARQEIADAQQEIDDLKKPVWYVMDRGVNPGYDNFENDAMKIAAIAKVFPVFFILVAALVCLTTMSRMIEEERTQMGTFKALGYSTGTIMAKYLLYALSATLLGSLAGLAIGFKVLPEVIFGAYGMMYSLPEIITPFRTGSALLITGSFLLCTSAVVLSTCWNEMKEEPAQLMRPKAPKAGKRVLLERIHWFWDRLSFLQKVTVRNLLRYKKRIFMTVLGISGCTALMLTGFGLKDSIGAVVFRQYDNIFFYDALAILEEDSDPADRQEMEEYLTDAPEVDQFMEVRQETLEGGSRDRWQDVFLFTPSRPDGLSPFVQLQDRRSGEAIPLTDEGAVITEKLAKLLDLQVGDVITLRDSDLNTVEVPVTGITENYAMHYVYVSPATYEKLYGEAPDYNAAAILMAEDGPEAENALSTSLMKNKSVITVSLTSDTRATFTDVVQSLNYVVVVLIVCAGALAFVVLYNLTNINITERIREIATIKVLGFYDREVSAYVYRENMVLTLLGTVVGLGLGVLLHAFVIQTAEVDTVMFGREISWVGFALSAALTLAFAAFVNFIMHFRLQKIDMVESLKSIE